MDSLTTPRLAPGLVGVRALLELLLHVHLPRLPRFTSTEARAVTTSTATLATTSRTRMNPPRGGGGCCSPDVNSEELVASGSEDKKHFFPHYSPPGAPGRPGPRLLRLTSTKAPKANPAKAPAIDTVTTSATTSATTGRTQMNPPPHWGRIRRPLVIAPCAATSYNWTVQEGAGSNSFST